MPLVAALAAVALLAGCSQPAAVMAPEPLEAPPAPQAEPVDWTGTMSISHCLQAAGATSCGSSIGPNGGSARPTYVHEAGGRALSGANLTLEWTPATPTTQALRIAAVALVDCPDDCTVERTLATEIGPSPLALSLGPIDGHGLAIAIEVEPVEFAPDLKVSLGQDVHLTGSLLFVERDPAAVAADAADDEEDEDEDGEPGS